MSGGTDFLMSGPGRQSPTTSDANVSLADFERGAPEVLVRHLTPRRALDSALGAASMATAPSEDGEGHGVIGAEPPACVKISPSCMYAPGVAASACSGSGLSPSNSLLTLDEATSVRLHADPRAFLVKVMHTPSDGAPTQIVRLHTHGEFQALKDAVLVRLLALGTSGSELTLSYDDDDGDRITLTCDAELADAIALAHRSGKDRLLLLAVFAHRSKLSNTTLSSSSPHRDSTSAVEQRQQHQLQLALAVATAVATVSLFTLAFSRR